MDVQVNETEEVDNIKELQKQLLNQVANADHQIRMLQEANDNNTATDSKTTTDSTVEYNTATDSNTATNSTTE
jgi:hypothetical protein